MRKNIMSEVAKALGVEVGDIIQIFSDKYMFTKDGLFQIDEHGEIRSYPECGLLHELLTGETEFIKIPWKPKHGDTYYSINIVGCKREPMVIKYFWDDYSVECLKDNALGMIYRTKEEAEAHLKDDYKKLTGLEG